MIYVVLCKVSQPSREEPKSYDGKFVTAKCSSINYGATLILTSNISVNYVHIFFNLNIIIILISKSSDLERRKVKKAMDKAK